MSRQISTAVFPKCWANTNIISPATLPQVSRSTVDRDEWWISGNTWKNRSLHRDKSLDTDVILDFAPCFEGCTPFVRSRRGPTHRWCRAGLHNEECSVGHALCCEDYSTALQKAVWCTTPGGLCVVYKCGKVENDNVMMLALETYIGVVQDEAG